MSKNTLDAKWKDEQVKFLERQQQRQADGQPAAAPGAKPATGMANRRPDPKNKFPGPISRDPMLLFRKADAKNHTDLPRPLNSNDHGHTGQQPTKYTKVALKKDIGTFKSGDTFEVAQVDFFTGLTKLYRTENDYLMGTPAYEGVYFSKGTIQYANLFYVREILEFLQRGHSLLDPNCRCIHKCGDDRARELGITLNKVRGALVDNYSIRDGKCTLSKSRCERTAVELAREVAVGDLYSITDQRGTRLVDVIASNPTIIVSQNEQASQLFAFKATLDAVSSKQELLQLVDASPLGLKAPEEKDTYNGVMADVELLAEEGLIYKLEHPEKKATLLFPRHRAYEQKVDADIKNLWSENGIKGALDMEWVQRQLREAGLQPARQAEREKVLGKRKGGGARRRRTTKKQNKNEHLQFLQKSS